MGHLRWLTLLALYLLTPAAVAAATTRQALLLDKSGSMQPYYASGLVNELRGKITAALSAHGTLELFAFNHQVDPVSGSTAISTGGATYLDKAIEYGISNKNAIVWMVTDNIQSEPGGTEGNTERFYRVLRGADVKRVTIFPLRQTEGTPGIAVYALLLSPDAAQQYEDGITAFINAVKSGTIRTEPLRMKPLDHNTVEISVVRSTINSRGEKPYEVGQTVRENLEVRFKSKFDYLKVIDAQIAVPKIEADFGPQSVLRPDRMNLDITPKVVKILNPQDVTAEVYQVEADLGVIRLKKDFASLWRAAFGKAKERHTLHLVFLINVPQQSFRLKDSFAEAYNASTPAIAKSTGKVYGIEYLPTLLTEDVTPIWAETQIPLTVKYPWWPSVLFIFGFLGILYCGVVVARRIKGGVSSLFAPKRWTVHAETEKGEELPCDVTDAEVLVRGSGVGRIEGNSFYPVETVSLLEQEGQRVTLADNAQVMLRTGRGELYRLIFSRNGRTKAAIEDRYTPGRR